MQEYGFKIYKFAAFCPPRRYVGLEKNTYLTVYERSMCIFGAFFGTKKKPTRLKINIL